MTRLKPEMFRLLNSNVPSLFFLMNRPVFFMMTSMNQQCFQCVFDWGKSSWIFEINFIEQKNVGAFVQLTISRSLIGFKPTLPEWECNNFMFNWESWRGSWELNYGTQHWCSKPMSPFWLIDTRDQQKLDTSKIQKFCPYSLSRHML